MADNIFADLIPQTGSKPGVILGPPKRPAPRDPLDDEYKRMQIREKELDLAKPNKDVPDSEKEALSAAIKGLGIEELLRGVGRARQSVEGGWATGVTGAVLGMVPGTEAANLRSEGGYLDRF